MNDEWFRREEERDRRLRAELRGDFSWIDRHIMDGRTMLLKAALIVLAGVLLDLLLR